MSVGGVRVPAELGVSVSFGLGVRVSARLATGPGPRPGGRGRAGRGGEDPHRERRPRSCRRRRRRKTGEGKGGGPAGQRGEEAAGCTGVWGAERRRDSGEQPGTAATAARVWAAVRQGRPVSVGEARPGGRRRPGCAGARGGGRAVRGPRPGRRRPWGRRAGPGAEQTRPRPGAERKSAVWASAPSPLPGPPWRPPANGDPGPEGRPQGHPGSRVCVLGRGDAGVKFREPQEPRKPGFSFLLPFRNLLCLGTDGLK